MSDAPLRVVLVDDHTVFREGLTALLGRHGIDVVGQASDPAGAYEVVPRERPDVVVLDMSLPGADGIEVARELQRRAPRCRILLLTMHPPGAHLERALEAGVLGYAVKSQSVAAIVGAIQATYRRELTLPPRGEPLPAAPETATPGGGIAALSRREREIFELVVRGLTNEELGRRLCISVKTVETHRARINRKCGVHSTGGLVRLAARNGAFL